MKSYFRIRVLAGLWGGAAQLPCGVPVFPGLYASKQAAVEAHDKLQAIGRHPSLKLVRCRQAPCSSLT